MMPLPEPPAARSATSLAELPTIVFCKGSGRTFRPSSEHDRCRSNLSVVGDTNLYGEEWPADQPRHQHVHRVDFQHA